MGNFFSKEITESVRSFQLERTPTHDGGQDTDSDHIECFVQNVLQWAEGKSRGEILQCVKYQTKTKQFMFVTGEVPVDAAVSSRFLNAAHPKKNRTPCASRHCS